MYKTNTVPIDKVGLVWPVVKDYITLSLEKSKSIFSLDKVCSLLISGEWRLLIAYDDNNVVHGAATVQTVPTPEDTVGFVTCIGGKLISDLDTFANFKDELRNLGITEIQGSVRPSIHRLWKRLGFTDKYTVVGVKL